MKEPEVLLERAAETTELGMLFVKVREDCSWIVMNTVSVMLGLLWSWRDKYRVFE